MIWADSLVLTRTIGYVCAMRTLIRPAEPRDVEGLTGLIGELAAFEKLSHQVSLSSSDLARHLFGERPIIECLVGEDAGVLVGFALFFTNFSTFLGKPGLYLEDLFVQESRRGEGLGGRLMSELAALAVSRDYGRFEWSVLDWNEKAIRFYERLGAAVMPDWRVCRVTGESLARLAARPDGTSPMPAFDHDF